MAHPWLEVGVGGGGKHCNIMRADASATAVYVPGHRQVRILYIYIRTYIHTCLEYSYTAGTTGAGGAANGK